MDRYFGCYKFASELRHKIIRETNLPISFAIFQPKAMSFHSFLEGLSFVSISSGVRRLELREVIVSR